MVLNVVGSSPTIHPKSVCNTTLFFYTPFFTKDELNKHTAPEAVSGYLKPLQAGLPVGVISEAGCPAVADPGADIVAIAQRKVFHLYK